MGTRHPNPRLVKIHRSYNVAEAAGCCKVHRNTIRQWIKRGLPIIDDGKPFLIHGTDLAGFLQARRASSKQPCKPGELYCVRCRAPKAPAGGMVEYQAITETLGNLIAICPDCDAIMNMRVSLAKLEHIRGQLDITMPQALPHIVKTA